MGTLSAEDLNWSLRRGVDAAEAAARFAEAADSISAFLHIIVEKRASGGGSRWGEIEDRLNAVQPEAVRLVSETFLDPDVIKWLVQQDSHIRDPENYMRYLQNLAERIRALRNRVLSLGAADSPNRPSGTRRDQKHQWLKDLFADNFLAVCDVVTDIRTERQLSGDTLQIRLFPDVIRFEQLMPADTNNLRDRYCEFRWKAVELLERSGAVSSVSLIEADHRWDSAIRVTVAEATFSEVVSVMEEEWAERTKDDQQPVSNDEPVVLLRKLLHRFHAVACQLEDRRESRPTLAIKDEYDVQDLLHALLRMHFDDVRPEEWSPSYAGKASRVDFYLKPEQIVVETKKTRQGLGAKELGDQLIIDTRRYAEMSGCKTLVCFVYDPDGLVKNRRGFENDLGGMRDGLVVEVIVAPRGF